MEGVGSGAVSAAALHKNFDLDALAADTPWKAGEAVPYLFLANTFDNIAPETKRLAIVAMLTGAFRAIIELTPDDLLPAVYLCVSRVRSLLQPSAVLRLCSMPQKAGNQCCAGFCLCQSICPTLQCWTRTLCPL